MLINNAYQQTTAAFAIGFLAALVAQPAASQTPRAEARLTVDVDKVLHVVNPNVYGHFFEHIYHSANGGLWGELIWNRSFELSNSGSGDWSIDKDEIVQSAIATDVNFVFGDANWKDYEVRLEALKERGAEGFMVLFRAEDADNFYWLNIGGWGNSRHAIEKEVDGNKRRIGPEMEGTIEEGRWYAIRIRCEGDRIQCWLENEKIIDIRDQSRPYLTGQIGLGTWGTAARYRNLRVTKLDGQTELYAETPGVPQRDLKVDFWTTVGKGKVERVQDAMNNDHSVQIITDGAPTGLRQDNFYFKRQAYKGSLAMKGHLPDGVKIELLNGDRVLAEATLAPPTAGWAEYPFELVPSDATESGSVRLTALGEGSVKLDHFTMMGRTQSTTMASDLTYCRRSRVSARQSSAGRAAASRRSTFGRTVSALRTSGEFTPPTCGRTRISTRWEPTSI